MEITPYVLSDRLRLELHCRADSSTARATARSVGRSCQACASARSMLLEMTIGQTAVLGCIEEDDPRGTEVRQTSATTKTKDKDDTVTLIFVTPTEIGEKIERPPPPGRRKARRLLVGSLVAQ